MPPSQTSSKKWLTVSAAAIAVSITFAGTPLRGAEKTLYDFRGGNDGADPYGGLISDGAGNLYGTTAVGGGGACEFGCGTIFKLGAGKNESVLHAFAGGNDGAIPRAGLISDNAGNFYGTTSVGGGANCAGNGCGTVFELAANGTETVLYAFQGGGDGSFPASGLVPDQDGNLYGTTAYGGSYNGSDCEFDGCGTVFEVESNGNKVTVYAFQGGSDGWSPVSGVIFDSQGNLYGTTAAGGSGCNGGGCGTVFELSPSNGTWIETVLYAFQDGSDGGEPYAGVIMDKAGNLYGTTADGGTAGLGTVFNLVSDGTETVLHSFQGGSDGSVPFGGVIMDKSGNLYGTTSSGGNSYCHSTNGCGTVFELSPTNRTWTETVLYAFRGGHGTGPAASLLPGAHGELYGTTTQGGAHKDGVVFKLKK